MTKRPVILSASFVRYVSEEGRYGDGRGGHGLTLLVKRTANGRLSKSWSQRLTIDGKDTRKGLGSYPGVSLATARRFAIRNIQAMANGCNPWEPTPSFAELADRTVSMNAGSWRGSRTEMISRSTLKTYAIPLLGERQAGEITVNDVLQCLEPIWLEKPHTSGKLRVMMSAVFKLAVANGNRRDNPAQDVVALLPRRKVTPVHHPAVPHQRIGEVLMMVRRSDASQPAKLCLD